MRGYSTILLSSGFYARRKLFSQVCPDVQHYSIAKRIGPIVTALPITLATTLSSGISAVCANAIERFGISSFLARNTLSQFESIRTAGCRHVFHYSLETLPSR